MTNPFGACSQSSAEKLKVAMRPFFHRRSYPRLASVQAGLKTLQNHCISYLFWQWPLIDYWDDCHSELIPRPSSAPGMNFPCPPFVKTRGAGALRAHQVLGVLDDVGRLPCLPSVGLTKRFGFCGAVPPMMYLVRQLLFVVRTLRHVRSSFLVLSAVPHAKCF